MAKIRNKKQLVVFLVVVFVAIILLIGEKTGLIDGAFDGLEQTMGGFDEVINDDFRSFAVHYIDVGQGDCSLVVCDGKTMLIDAGENGHEEDVINYLRSQSIDKLDYIVTSHQHSDHIGGLEEVIEEFGADTLIMPRLTKAQTPTNSTYTAFLKSVQKSGMKVLSSNVGDVYQLGSASFEILGPVTNDAEDINNMSIMMKLTYGENTFMFTGDAEKEEELEVIGTGANLDCDVLKVGHHGSNTSSCKQFLAAVSPELCIIQVGENNDYGHPHKEPLNRIKKFTEDIYRNDICGDIVVYSDGITLEVEYENQ
ncbi:MAG: MBL fold metallo-hydrolase [Clostridia bacterium]|nr:MBL fold metallo-hydrolase [Clostridia bacterium]